ncbi:MAG: hypothetical protein JST63_05535 [Bacteroidetes bacterium]|nr:hypothetical protein [Bacteroidota bacterium]
MQTIVAASVGGDLIESSEMKNCQEYDSQYESLLNQRTCVSASVVTTLMIAKGYKSPSV